MELVPVRSFDNYIEANIVLGRLQHEGIQCFLQDEYTVTIDPILTNAIGGIKLMVPRGEMPAVIALLQAFEEEKRAQFRCPVCSGNDIQYISNPRRAGNWLTNLISFFLASYALSNKKVYHCFHCGFETEELNEVSERE